MKPVSKRSYRWIAVGLVLALVLSTGVALAAALLQYPTAGGSEAPTGGWPTDAQWKSIPSLNDGASVSIAPEVDFVGDLTYPGAYYYSNATYLFFRIRVEYAGTVTATTFQDSHLILIDKEASGLYDGKIDCGFAWDSKSNDITAHGLENQVPPSPYPTSWTNWKDVKMDDKDGDAGKKIAPLDFNTSGDGYIRTMDSQPFTGSVNTTFIDYAMSWSFLATNSCIKKGDRFKIQLGSLENSVDHNAISADVAGGYDITSPIVGAWSNTVGSTTNAVTLSSLSASAAGPGLPWAAAVAALGLVGGGVVWRRWQQFLTART